MKKIGSFKLFALLLPAGMGIMISCKKDFLDKKPSSDLVVPTTLDDFQALLDNDNLMQETPELGELSCDDYYLTNALWGGGTINTKEHNANIWAKDIYQGQGNVDDWNLPYQQVFYTNVVKEGLNKLTVDNTNVSEWRALMGAAYFIRAYAYYNLAQVFSPLYDPNISPVDDKLGIPLKDKPEIDTVTVRSTVKETYAKILADLQTASALLPVAVPAANRNRPSKPAALAMLARVYLSMRDYSKAGLYADSCLRMYNTLIDYNTVSGFFPFSKNNVEALYQSRLLGSSQVFIAFGVPGCIVDSNLYRSYATGDLRRSLFYFLNANSGLPNIRWSYNGLIYPFSGLATDEVYLIRAECAARTGNIAPAIDDLNTLLQKRWTTGTFVPIVASTPQAALDTILVERRKELAFRGVRWTDMRRLNKEGTAFPLTRILNGQTYSLPPNVAGYLLPIPPDVLKLSGIPDNPR